MSRFVESDFFEPSQIIRSRGRTHNLSNAPNGFIQDVRNLNLDSGNKLP